VRALLAPNSAIQVASRAISSNCKSRTHRCRPGRCSCYRSIDMCGKYRQASNSSSSLLNQDYCKSIRNTHMHWNQYNMRGVHMPRPLFAQRGSAQQLHPRLRRPIAPETLDAFGSEREPHLARNWAGSCSLLNADASYALANSRNCQLCGPSVFTDGNRDGTLKRTVSELTIVFGISKIGLVNYVIVADPNYKRSRLNV